MKNKMAIFIILSMLSFTPRAEALQLDPAVWISKISGWVQKQMDAVNKIQQQVNKIKQIATQGFSKEALLNLASQYALNQSKLYFAAVSQKIIENTKAKELSAMKSEQDEYIAGQKAYSESKILLIQENLDNVATKKMDNASELSAIDYTINSTQSAYNAAKGTSEESERLAAYMEAVSKKEALELNAAELDYLENELNTQKSYYEDEESEIGTENDVKYQLYEDRIAQLEEQDDNDTIFQLNIDDDDEWDDIEKIETFSPTNDNYKIFIGRYFLDPNSLSDISGADGRIKYQTKTDTVIRERRFLVTNTAAHLLQVSATVSREVPYRQTVADEMFASTTEASGELEAMASYSSTRIENMRALLLYAKLLSAKIQYSAASELLKSDIEKELDSTRDYTNFDLSSYVLTEDDVDAVVAKANSSLNIDVVYE